jgi:hypothetical protein
MRAGKEKTHNFMVMSSRNEDDGEVANTKKDSSRGTHAQKYAPERSETTVAADPSRSENYEECYESYKRYKRYKCSKCSKCSKCYKCYKCYKCVTSVLQVCYKWYRCVASVLQVCYKCVTEVKRWG